LRSVRAMYAEAFIEVGNECWNKLIAESCAVIEKYKEENEPS